jgi:hypothetical protein
MGGGAPQPSPPSREGTTPLTLALNLTPAKGKHNMANRTTKTSKTTTAPPAHRLKPRRSLECGLKPQRSEAGRWNLIRYALCGGGSRALAGPLARSVRHPPYFLKSLVHEVSMFCLFLIFAIALVFLFL